MGIMRQVSEEFCMKFSRALLNQGFAVTSNTPSARVGDRPGK